VGASALADALVALVAPFVAAPARAALMFDLDGTLAPIVDDPAAARPIPDALPILERLAERYHTVAVVSGRPVAFLAEVLPASIVLSGLYGLEGRVGGRFTHHRDAARWRPVVTEAVQRAERGAPDGSLVEPKGLSLTMHYRGRPDLADAVNDFAARLGAELGLAVHAAKMSVELHPPIAVDKGTAVRSLAEGADAALYVGDDRGDLPAFAALGELAGKGTSVARVAIGGPEVPGELAAAADLVLAQQSDVTALLAALVPS